MFQTISPVFFSELESREHEGCSLCTDSLNKVSKLLEVFLNEESRRYTISTQKKNQNRWKSSFPILLYYSAIETFSFLQLLQAEYMGMWGLWDEVDLRQEPPLLGGTAGKRLRLLSLTDFITVL